MRLVLALKIDLPIDQDEFAMQVMGCLEKLPVPFRSVVAFTPDDGLVATVAHLNKFFEEKRNDSK